MSSCDQFSVVHSPETRIWTMCANRSKRSALQQFSSPALLQMLGIGCTLGHHRSVTGSLWRTSVAAAQPQCGRTVSRASSVRSSVGPHPGSGVEPNFTRLTAGNIPVRNLGCSWFSVLERNPFHASGFTFPGLIEGGATAMTVARRKSVAVARA